MIFAILYDGEIAKSELDDISQHSLFANLIDKMNRCYGKSYDLTIDRMQHNINF